VTDTPEEVAVRARGAQRVLRAASGEARAAVLRRLDALLVEREAALLEANARDVALAEREGLAAPLLRRLALTPTKLAVLRDGVRQLAAAPDPVGEVVLRRELDQGLVLRQVKSPIGVLLVVFESRPDAVIQIGALALRSGNAVILKGGAEARESNRALTACLRDALSGAPDGALEPDAVGAVEDREGMRRLLALDQLIDLVIPRGSSALVRHVQESTRIPVLGHAEGICHLYVDRAADPAMAARLVVDGKCDAPSACNATETLLVHRDFLPRLPALGDALRARGVELRADPEALAHLPGAVPAGEGDGDTEYGDLVLAVFTVASLDEALAFVAAHGSGHTDAIVTEDAAAAARFLAEVDSASVFHNASTRFADGYRYGLGAEVGISTGRIHARGPVGLEGLLTTRWLLEGQGQVAGDYGPGKRAFTHRDLTPE
jgi:glutamate-5-semialdehyde dehydrogenase